MQFKIDQDERGLCPRCKNAQIIKYTDGSFTIDCSEFGLIKKPVESCTAYNDPKTPSEWDMRQIAWIINSDKKGNFIGFIKPKKDE